MCNVFNIFTLNKLEIWAFLSEGAKYWEMNRQIGRGCTCSVFSKVKTVAVFAPLVTASEKHVLTLLHQDSTKLY